MKPWARGQPLRPVPRHIHLPWERPWEGMERRATLKLPAAGRYQAGVEMFLTVGLARGGVLLQTRANWQRGGQWLGLRSSSGHSRRPSALPCCHSAAPQPAVPHRPAPWSRGRLVQAGHHFAIFPAFHFVKVPSWKFYNFPLFRSRLQLWLLEEAQGCRERLNVSWRTTSSTSLF